MKVELVRCPKCGEMVHSLVVTIRGEHLCFDCAEETEDTTEEESDKEE